jgi:F-type H+-transporting ATPase subunit delta
VSQESIARRWASALYELGKETSSLVDLNRDMANVAAAYELSDELRDALSNPLVAEASREAILADLGARLGIGDTARRALGLLARKRRLPILRELAAQLARMTDDDAGLVRASVTSAAPLSEAYLGRLRAELEKASGKRVTLEHKLDPSLLAGVVTRMGDLVIDGTLKARLQGFRDALL